jgi:polysaccharide pyruvyl transferase CsaB
MAIGMNSLKSIIISGYFGFDNCGDEAILLAMIQEFSRYFPKEKIIVLSQNPRKTEKLYQINAIHRLNPFLIICRIMRSSIFISGGGGLLQDVSGKGYSVFYYLSLLYLARLFNVPSVIYAQGVGPIEKSINRKLIKWALSKVNLIMVRDEQSKKLLQEIGIKNKSITVNADPSFLLKKKELSELIKIKYRLNNQGVSDEKMKIGIVVRNCKEIGQDYDNKIEQFAKISDHLIKEYRANLFFIPFQIHTDLPFIEEIIKKMKFVSAECIEEELSPDQMLSLYSKISLIIGMRFHSIVFATMMNKPFLAIDYDPKVKYFVNSLDIPELLINLNQLTVKIIDNKLKYIRINKERIQSSLYEKKEQFEQKAYCNTQQLYQLIIENCFRKE